MTPEPAGSLPPDDGQGWTSERLPVWAGAWIAFAVPAAGAGPCLVLAVLGGSLGWFYLGLAGMVASGVAGMALVWHLQPADLDVPPAGQAATKRRPDRVDTRLPRAAHLMCPHLGTPAARGPA
jgi:hypothetical protein